MPKRPITAPVEWLSNKEEWQEINDPKFTYKIVDFYTKFKFKNITAEIGDFVLISNVDAAEPDTLEGCDVAQITKLYESHDMDLSDRFRAHIQWFCKIDDVPKTCIKNTDIILENEAEVIEDHRPFDKDVSIETFFKKCEISKLPTTAAVSEIIKNQTYKIPTFFCRYRLVNITRKKFALEPILEEERKVYSRVEMLMKTPKSKPRESLVNGQTPNSLIKKFASSSLNEKSSWVVKNAEDSKVVLMKDITNKYSITPSKDTPSKGQNKRKSACPSGNTPIKVINIKVQPRKLTEDEITKLLESDDESDFIDNASKSAKRNLNFESKSSRLSSVQNHKTSENLEDTPSKRRTSRMLKSNVRYCEDFVNLDNELNTKNKTYTPRKSIKDVCTTPKRTKSKAKLSESDSDDDFLPKTPKRGKGIPKTPRTPKTPINKNLKKGELTPSIRARVNPVVLQDGGLQLARESLHVSAVPLSLPCREQEFNNIYTFIEGKISDNSGGCMYISGVPGTGKTATVTEVIRCLNKQVKKSELSKFDFIEVNGMRLTEPRQAYVHIYRQLTGKTVAWEQACNLLEARFTKPAPRRCTTVILIDELDVLCNRRQDVLYNLLDWPSKSAAHLVVVAIANTMDLPERLLMGRVASRLGLTRLTFQPYTFTQLQNIVTARLADTGAFNADAVQLVSRKVAAVSGDARRALDICRRAVELAEIGGKEQQVGLQHVNSALAEMIASPKVSAIRCCSKMEKLFLQATSAEVQRTGIEETMFQMIYKQLETICVYSGLNTPSVTETLAICSRLGSCRLIISEHSRNDIFQKVLLNVSTDDVHYATKAVSVF